MVSVVIPTYNEAAVISETLRRAAAALKSTGEPYELLVVDDGSPDETADIAQRVGDEFPVRVLRRAARQGLATAVLEGWALARGDLLGVMDADLQHPPEALRDFVEAAKKPEVDLVIASRYARGGTSRGPWLQRITSRTAIHLASCVLPLTLAEVTDPMSGMFLVRRSAIEGVRLSPLGYKILLEVLGKGHYRRLAEVAIVDPGGDSSKLGPRQALEYVWHLWRLAGSTGQRAAWARYALVGLAGAALDIALVYLLSVRLGWPLVLALAVAIQTTLLNNFFWNETLTFRPVRDKQERDGTLLSRLKRYEWTCLPGALLNGVVVLVAVAAGAQVLPAAALGVLAGGFWNMVFRLPRIWKVWGSHRPPQRENAV
jgi:dolichol-phosphate mannosyltransferase